MCYHPNVLIRKNVKDLNSHYIETWWVSQYIVIIY